LKISLTPEENESQTVPSSSLDEVTDYVFNCRESGDSTAA
jgi:hypothetical protein